MPIPGRFRQRRLLEALYLAALAGADPARLVRNSLKRRDVRRAIQESREVGIFAAGKAAAAMTLGARARLGPRRALVILPAEYPAPRRISRDAVFAAHPEPDASSMRAARGALRFFRSFGKGDLILCLISGGTSSLLALPRKRVTLTEKKRAVGDLARSGASILALNRLRTSLSAVKGGRLGKATEARLATLVLSDVPGDRAAVVGSGPTVRSRRGDIVRVVGSNASGIEAAEREARRRGLRVLRRPARLSGEARLAGRRLAREALALPSRGVLLAGGETVVTLESRHGRGGRSLELALAAAIALDGTAGIAMLAAGSDGKDGASDSAGAFVDGATAGRARRRGLDPAEALRRHDSHPLLERLGDLFVTGPTGTNVGDWVFALRR